MAISTVICLLMLAVSLAQCEYNTFTSSMKTDDAAETFGEFKRIGDKYYLFETSQRVNWYEAWLSCRRHGSHLASFESLQELNALTGDLKDRDDRRNLKFWTAGHKVNGYYMWMTHAESVGRNLFEAGKPKWGEQGLDCLYMRNGIRDFKLVDGKCDVKIGYICQMEMKILELNAA